MIPAYHWISPIAAMLLAFLIVMTAIAERRDYRALVSVRTAYQDHLNTDSADWFHLTSSRYKAQQVNG